MSKTNINEQLTSEIPHRRHDDKELLDRLEFEQMLSGISASLMAVPFDEIDNRIEDALKKIKDFFQVDLCALLEVHQERDFAKVSHVVLNEGIEPIPEYVNLVELYPWTYKKLMRGEIINITRLEDYPEEALIDRQSNVTMGTISRLVFPVLVDGRVSRVITIHHRRRDQAWSEEYIPRLRLLGEILVNALERSNNRLQIEEQRQFDTLLANVSARFVNLPADKVDDEIIDAQRSICEFLGLDLSVLWQWSMEKPRILKLTHLSRTIDPSPPEPMYAHDYFPWCQEEIEAGRMVVVSCMEDVPAEASRDKETWRHFGIKTTLTFPLTLGGSQPIGALSFNSIQQERIWPEPLIKRLQLVAQIFSSALARKRADEDLRESEARLSLATEAVDAGLWIMDVDTKKVWVSPKSRELFHFAPDEEITYESYFRVIHPEDRERVQQDVQHALKTGEKLHCDYRIILPDGSIRWIVARGQRYCNATGKPERLMGLSFDITNHKKMEEAIHQSEHRFQTAFMTSVDAYLIAERDTGRMTEVNDRMVELYGYTRDEFIGHSSLELGMWVYPEARQKMLDQLRKEGRIQNLEVFARKKSGEGFWVLYSLSELKNQGTPLILGIIHDITERKKMEMHLSESQTLLSALFNSTTDLIWSVDPENFGLVEFNRGLSEYFAHGVALHIKAGMTPDDLLPKEFAQQWHMFYRRALEEGSFTTEYQAYAQGRTLRLNLNTLKRGDVVFGISVFGQDITERKQLENQLRQSLEEVHLLKERLQTENVYLREEMKQLQTYAEIVGESKPIKEVLTHAEKVGPTDSTVLILGETGTGKELLAHAIHDMSNRKDRTIVMVNCASLPPTLIESELFGREKGAYTGSLTKMAGRFELADGSTLFLDEIGDLPLELQSKLLRVLEQGEFERLGSSKTIKVNVRLIAATNRDISQEVKEGRFRKDLYYRLNVFPITIPPLRDRKEDIPSLVWSFVKQFEKSLGKFIESIPKNNMEALMLYSWPGNIRELRNVIEHAMILSPGKTLNVEPPAYSTMEQSVSPNLQDVERRHIIEVLERADWRLSGQNGAAEILGMKRTTLQSKMKALGIKRKVS